MEKNKPRILLIEDEQAVRTMYIDQLTKEGFEVLTAPDGQKGVEMASSEKPDAILLDIILPKLNGLDVLQILKENAELKDIPVYILTNLPQESSQEKSRELGAAGYFVKADHDPSEVAEYLKNAVRSKEINPSINPR